MDKDKILLSIEVFSALIFSTIEYDKIKSSTSKK